MRRDKPYKLLCVRRKRNHATAPRARQGVNLTCGDDIGTGIVRFINLRAGGAIARGLLKESRTFLSFVRRNNLAAEAGSEASQRRVKCASAHILVLDDCLPRCSCYYFMLLLVGYAAAYKLCRAHSNRVHLEQLDSTAVRCPPVEFPRPRLLVHALAPRRIPPFRF